jgi:hypothetical protein
VIVAPFSFYDTHHNGTDFDYTYDGFGRLAGVKIAGIPYCATRYETNVSDKTDTERAVLSTGQGFETFYDKHGRVWEVRYIRNGMDSASVPYLKNEYDLVTGNLVKTIEYTADGTEIRAYVYGYDAFGRVISNTEKTVDGTTVVTSGSDYDAYGKETSAHVTADGVTTRYAYTYDDKPDARLMQIQAKDADGTGIFAESLVYDKQGRASERELAAGGKVYGECTDYLKVSDHATQLIKGIRYSVPVRRPFLKQPRAT